MPAARRRRRRHGPAARCEGNSCDPPSSAPGASPRSTPAAIGPTTINARRSAVGMVVLSGNDGAHDERQRSQAAALVATRVRAAAACASELTSSLRRVVHLHSGAAPASARRMRRTGEAGGERSSSPDPVEAPRRGRVGVCSSRRASPTRARRRDARCARIETPPPLGRTRRWPAATRCIRIQTVRARSIACAWPPTPPWRRRRPPGGRRARAHRSCRRASVSPRSPVTRAAAAERPPLVGVGRSAAR
jgi:hypothetical protein